MPYAEARVGLLAHALNYGTAAQITAVTRVDHRAVGSRRLGEITRRLRTLFTDVVRGRVAAHREWCAPVYLASRRA